MKKATLLIIEPHAELISAKYAPDCLAKDLRLIEECGRVSHKSEGRITDESAEPFVKKIALQYGHESILEHATFTVCFVLSRSASHQLVRHRIGAFTQESQRYCDYSGDGSKNTLRVIVPPSVGTPVPGSVVSRTETEIRVTGPGDPTCDVVDPCTPLWVYLQSALDSYQCYLSLREEGAPAEDAREVLPNATKTEVYTTFNLRQWRHVFRMRLDKHAQWQIRKCIREVYDYFRQEAPWLVEGLTTHSGDPLRS